MEILEKISEYLNEAFEYLKEFAINAGNKISDISANIKQQSQQKRNNSHSFESNPYVEGTREDLSFNFKDGIKSIDQSYREIRYALSPIGSIVLIVITFFFLYQYAIENIRINEKLIIFLVTLVAALLNIFCTGIEFLPVCALVFFSIWEKNLIVAALAAVFIFTAVFSTESQRRGKYVYPLIIMILIGCVNNSGVFFVLALLFMCSLFWYNSTFPMLTPLLIIINIMTVGTATYLPAINKLASSERVNLFNVPVTEYIHTVLGNKEFAIKAFDSFVSYMQANYPVFIVIYIGLYVIVKIFRTIVKMSKIDRGSLKYIIIAHLYCAIGFYAVFKLAHFVHAYYFIVLMRMTVEERIKLLNSFDNLLGIVPMATAHMKNVGFIRITIGEIVTAILLSIPISVFVKGYEKSK